MTDFVARARKAVVAAIIGGAYALQAALTDGVSNDEWKGIAAAALAAALVYLTPNKDA